MSLGDNSMAGINVSVTDVKKYQMLLKDSKHSIEKLVQRMSNRLRNANGTWDDENYKKLEDIAIECVDSLNKVYQVLLNADKYLENIFQVVTEYENALTTNGSTSSAYTSSSPSGTASGLPYASSLERPKVLSRDKNEMIAAGLRAIDNNMEVYKDDLKDKGIVNEVIVSRMIQEARDAAERELYDDVYGGVEEKCISSLQRLSTYFKSENWAKMDHTERKDALNTLAKDVGFAFRTNVLGVRFYDGPQSSRGYYNNDGYLYLNADVLTDDTNRLDALDTVFHEGRHAFQRVAISNPNLHSVERSQAETWANNFINYVSPNRVNMRRYFSQPVEVDAREFAASVLRNGGIQ